MLVSTKLVFPDHSCQTPNCITGPVLNELISHPIQLSVKYNSCYIAANSVTAHKFPPISIVYCPLTIHYQVNQY